MFTVKISLVSAAMTLLLDFIPQIISICKEQFADRGCFVGIVCHGGKEALALAAAC